MRPLLMEADELAAIFVSFLTSAASNPKSQV
jgi:hypothetical protein